MCEHFLHQEGRLSCDTVQPGADSSSAAGKALGGIFFQQKPFRLHWQPAVEWSRRREWPQLHPLEPLPLPLHFYVMETAALCEPQGPTSAASSGEAGVLP